MTDYNIYSIRSYNNDKLVFYNYTKRKRIGDILSGYKTRFKRHLNNKDNWINVFYILQEYNSYIKIEEQIVNSNDEIVKSRLCEIIANNNCINKMKNEDIEKLCNETKEQKTEITENAIQNTREPKTEVIDNYFNTEPTNTETKIVKYVENIADNSNNQIELLNDESIYEPVELPTIQPIYDVKVVKNLADVKSIDNFYEPSITSSSRYSKPFLKEEIEQLKEEKINKHKKTIKFDSKDVVKIINNKRTLKNIRKI